MKNLKNIITGILSGAVFFMAVQVGVAQEKAVASDKVEVTGSVEAMVLAHTLSKLNTAEKADRISSASSIKYTPAVKKTLTPQWYERVSGDGSNPTDYLPLAEDEEPTCTTGDEICAVKALPGMDPDNPNPQDLARILQENPTSGSHDPNEIRFEN